VSGLLLVTGGTGYLGAELLRQASGRRLAATHLNSEPGSDAADWIRLDIRDPDAVRRAFDRLRPQHVIHTAYRQEDRAVTTDGAAAVAEAAAAVGARLVHLSSDLVFGGAKRSPYTEADRPDPISDYGRAKADAERAVLSAHPAALVVRTSLIYGGERPSRAEQAALEHEEGAVFFDDELRSPVLISDLAAALLELLEADVGGFLHVAGADVVSRYRLACLFAEAHGRSPERITRGTIAASGLVRPTNCALDSSRARGLLRTRLRGVREWAGAPAPPPPR
jgi:dTDP-4-dehydrorhamnose reductase